MFGDKLGDKLTANQSLQPFGKLNQSRRNVPKAQEAIYEFLLEIVKNWAPDDVLKEFKHLFIHHSDTVGSSTLPYLYEIVFANQEHEFRNTLKRCCYILINNWDLTRNHEAIQKLVQLFSDPILYKYTISPTLKRLREWLRNFIASADFQELKLFAARYEDRGKIHWSQRYTSYLLVPQYINLENPLEQRQAARNLSKKLKEQFKFELAMYTALSESAAPREQSPQNPTSLGDEVVRLIKRIVAKRGFFSYPNIAHIFLNQTKNLTYRSFKQSLLEYLIFSVEQDEFAVILKAQLSEKLSTLYMDHDDKAVTSALILRTANRILEYLTTENHQEPSALFVLLLSQGNSLTLVIVLLKIILICRYARTHLEARIADLIRYYSSYSEEECQWVVNFFEMFRIVTAIYTENIEYNLVNMNESCSRQELAADTEVYRIFSQLKRRGLELEPDILEMKTVEASLEAAKPLEEV
ncbi:MAG: hypothetical protein IGS54_20860 [Elainella sp. C42_A2020_010]|nr:hypothetical protein [Elainella sp. C42_A2020_010]